MLAHAHPSEQALQLRGIIEREGSSDGLKARGCWHESWAVL